MEKFNDDNTKSSSNIDCDATINYAIKKDTCLPQDIRKLINSLSTKKIYSNLEVISAVVTLKENISDSNNISYDHHTFNVEKSQSKCSSKIFYFMSKDC